MFDTFSSVSVKRYIYRTSSNFRILTYFKVLVTKSPGKTKVLLATDSREPITLHWALSKNNAGEWLVRFQHLSIE